MKLPKVLVPLEEQAWRFVRLFAAALVTQVVPLGHLDRSAVIAAVVAAAEVAWKEVSAQVSAKNLAHNAIVELTGDPTVGTDNK